MLEFAFILFSSSSMVFKVLRLPLFPVVFGWGGDGHSIVTQVASELVTERGLGFVKNLVGDDLIEASRWPDTPEASERYPDSDNYHFSHTPYRDCKPFDIDRDCGFPGKEGLCIVTGLADAIKMAIDPEVERDDRAEALKFVLHLMADIHQPLHTGFREDAGGTAIDISNAPNATLHTLWDYGIIQHELEEKNWRTLSGSILRSLNSNDRRFIHRIANQSDLAAVFTNANGSAIVEYIATIASETVMSATCKVAYTRDGVSYIESGDSVDEEYLRRGMVVVQIQLSKAAVRLALLIDTMASVYASRLAERKEASRAIRVEKLFERMRIDAAEKAARVYDPLEGNPFRVLAIEFNIEEYLYEPEEFVVESHPTFTRISKQERRAIIAAQKAEETRRLKQKSRRDARKRRERMVEGIDLNSLVLIKRSGQYFITYEKFVTSNRFYPKRSVVVFLKFANQLEAEKPIGFLLDNNIFLEIPSTEFMTQLFKAIKGDEDCLAVEKFQSPVSSVHSLISEKPPLDPIATSLFATGAFGKSEDAMMADVDAERKAAKDAYLSRFKSTEDRLRYEAEIDRNNVAHMSRFINDLVVIVASNTMFVSTYAFCKGSMSFTFNKYMAINSKVSIETDFNILVDIRLLDEDLTDGALAIIRRAIITPSVRKRTESLRKNCPLFYERFLKFVAATGFGGGESRILELVFFKRFERLERSDKPLMSTFAVDLTHEPSRAAVAKALLQSFQQKPTS